MPLEAIDTTKLVSNAPVSRAEFELLVAQVKENTRVTKEVREILDTFRVLYRVASFIAVVAAIVTAWFNIKG
jgi:hypothetical protein